MALRKKGCGAPKRKLRRPLLPWGREPPPPPTGEGWPLRRQRSLLLRFGFLSIHKEVGGGFPVAPAQRVPRPGYCEASQVAAQPGRVARTQLWSGCFLNRVGTQASLSLFWTPSPSNTSNDIPLSRLGN